MSASASAKVLELATTISTAILPGPAQAAVKYFVDKRLEAIIDQLTEDLKAGKIRETQLHDNPNLGGYVFRLSNAIKQGARLKNIRLLARYLFGTATAEDGAYDNSVEYAAIIEGLSDDEIRCLAVYDKAISSGRLLIRPEDGSNPDLPSGSFIPMKLDLLDLFPTEHKFHIAATSLQRWGLVAPTPTMYTDTFEPTEKLLALMKRLDLDGMILQ